MASKKMPSWMAKDYEDWKRNLWAAFRSFFAGFVSTMGVFLVTTNMDALKNPEAWASALLMGSLVGGLIALGKFLRDLFPESKSVNRIPF